MMDPSNIRMPASHWIHANAGSGKTYALVRQILGLLVRGVAADSIMCLTYTNAAAAEMQARLANRLRDFSLMPEPELKADLADLLGASPDIQTLAHCRGLASAMLDAVPGIGFFTIHGFCQRILSSFPVESGVSAYFTLLDERRGAELIQQAYASLLRAATRQPDLKAAIDQLHAQASERYARDILTQSLRQRRIWETAWSGGGVLDHRIDTFFGIETADYASLVTSRYAPNRLAELRQAAEILIEAGGKEAALGVGILAWCDSPNLSLWPAYRLLWLTQKNEPRKTLVYKAFRSKHPDIERILLEEQAIVATLTQAEHAIAAAVLSKAVALLTRHFLHLYDQIKFNEQALDYDDLLLKTVALLADDRVRPWVLYKLDQRIAHILIDEAQDTSPEQWAMLEALFSELLQAGGAGGKSVFVVGDLKQSIYSFQGAAPKLFVEQKPKLVQQLSYAGMELNIEHLETSRRSVPVVLDLVDKVCADPAVIGSFVSEGDLRAHISHRAGQGGHVCCWPAIDRPEKEVVDKLLAVRDYTSQVSAIDIWAAQLAETIKGWLDNERKLIARNRAVEAGDILILLQKRGRDSQLAQAIIRALEARSIAVAGLDRLRLGGHLAVRDHMALFEWCLHPYDDYHLAMALRSPLGGLSEEELFTIAHDRGDTTLWEALSIRLPQHSSINRLERWKEQAGELPVHTLLQQMHGCDGVRERYAERFGSEVFEVLDALLAEAERYDAEPNASLRGFVSAMGRDSSELKREADTGEGKLRVMTVHGAKGLEAPIVILADAFSTPSKQDILLFSATNEGIVPCLRVGKGKDAPQVRAAMDARMRVITEEYYRLLYVALTRAEDELYIGGAATRLSAEGSGIEPWHSVVARAVRSMQNVQEDADGTLRVDGRQEKSVAVAEEVHISMPAVSLPDYFKRSVAKETGPARIYSPSSLGHASYTSSDDVALADVADRGVVIHRILQWIEQRRPKSERDVLAWLKHEAPYWNEDDRLSAARDIWALYTDKTLQWLWSNPSYNEVNIAGMLHIHGVARQFGGQIDRLVVTPEARVIIDYKTARNIPSRDALPERYLLQMLAYKKLLEADGSGKPVRAGLLYTAGPTLFMLDNILETLDFPALDAA